MKKETSSRHTEGMHPKNGMIKKPREMVWSGQMETGQDSYERQGKWLQRNGTCREQNQRHKKRAGCVHLGMKGRKNSKGRIRGRRKVESAPLSFCTSDRSCYLTFPFCLSVAHSFVFSSHRNSSSSLFSNPSFVCPFSTFVPLFSFLLRSFFILHFLSFLLFSILSCLFPAGGKESDGEKWKR